MPSSTDRLTAVLDAARGDGTGPGIAAALVDRGGTTAMAATGIADLASARPMTLDAAACIGSISKTFTAAAILRLRDEGRLTLADPVVRHLPEIAGFRDPFGAAATATIRDLLRHTAGLPTEAPSTDLRRWDPVTIDIVLGDPRTIEWAIAPGTTFKYSNLGYELLGEVVARTSGRSYADHVSSELLEPLGMTATTPGPSSTAARGHEPLDQNGQRLANDRTPAGVAAGGWWSTARDLARWLRVQLAPDTKPGGWVGSTIVEGHRPLVVTDESLDGAYGLGWRLLRRGDHVHLGHGGLTVGFEARVEADLVRGLGAVVLLNGIGPDEPTTRLVARLFAEAGDDETGHDALGEPEPAPAADSARVDASGLAGRYREVGFERTVTLDVTSDGWWLSETGDPGGPLHRTSDPDRFRLAHGRVAGESLVVLRDPGGRIDAINLAGYPMTRLPD